MASDASDDVALRDEMKADAIAADPFAAGMAAACRLARAVAGAPFAAIHLRGHQRVFADAAPELSPDTPSLDEALASLSQPVRTPHAGATGLAHLPFYVSCPLGSDDDDIGVLVVAGSEPYALDTGVQDALNALAKLVAAQVAMQASLRNAETGEAHYRLLADHSTDTLVRGTLDGIRIYVSPAVKTLLGYEPEELVGRRASEIVHPDDAAGFRELMSKVRQGVVAGAVSELRQRHKNGSWVWMEASIQLTRHPVTREPDGYVVSVRDVSRRKETELRLEHTASHDMLTDLPNRARLYARLNQEIARAQRTGGRFAVFCMDIDRFKTINDSLGHAAGDEVLRQVARRFRDVVRGEDTIGRLGGDEFVLIQTIDDDRAHATHRLAERLIEAVSQPIEIEGAPLQVGLSIGIAFAAAGTRTADQLISAADQALYKAKQAGRNRYLIHDDAA